MKREAPVLFVALCALILFAPFWLQGRVFVPGDFLSFIYPWKAQALPPPRNLELFDVTVFFYPQDVFLNETLKRGHLPLWNPHILLGHPMVGSGQSALLYPPRLLAHWLFSPAVARTLIILVHCTLDGLLMYLWLRGRGLLPWAAVVGGVAWMLNGQVAGWLEFEHVPVIAAFLPAMLWCVDRRRWGLLAVAGALSLQGGHLQYNLYTGLIVGFYCLLQLRSRRAWLGVAGATVLTLLLAAPTLLPFLELLSQSQRVSFTVEQLRETMAPTLPSLLGTLVCPDLWGNPARGFMFNRVKANLIYPEFACFFGLIPLGLALLAAVRARRAAGLPAREVGAWSTLAVLSLLFAAATPVYQLVLLVIPKLSILVPARALLTFHFAGAVLAAQGAHTWLTEGPPRALVPLCLTLTAAWGAVLGGIHWVLGTVPAAQWTFPVKIPPYDAGWPALEAAARANYGSPQMWLPLLLLPALCWRPRGPWLAVLASADLLLFACWFNPAVPPASLFPPTPPTSYLQSHPGPYRVDKHHAAFYNTLVPYGAHLLSGYESMFPRRVYQTLSAAEPGSTLSMRSLGLQRFDSPVLAAFALRYLVLPPQETLPAWERRAEGLWESRKALGRAFTVGGYRVFRNVGEVAQAMAEPTFTPADWVALEAEPGGPVDPACVGSPVRFRVDQPDRVELEVGMKGPGLLVLSDTFYPGWQARVDGDPRPVQVANGCGRAVRLDAGNHVVEFVYQPQSVRWGVGACALGLLLLLAGRVCQRLGLGKSETGSSLTT